MNELQEAADRLRAMAVERFAQHGPDDVRGAAIWDSANWIIEQFIPEVQGDKR